MGLEWRQFALQARAVEQAELDRNVVETARPEATVEMAQARDSDPYHGNADIGPGLVQHQEIIAGLSRDLDTGLDLASAVVGQLQARCRRHRRMRGGKQEGIVLQLERGDAVERGLL